MIFSNTINIFSYIHTYKNAVAGRILRHFNPVLGDSGRNPLEPGTGFLTFMELTQELVKSIFDYHEDGYLIWKVSTGSSKLGKMAGNLNDRNRYTIGILGKIYRASRIIFLWHHGYLPTIVDHENHNTSDDKIKNLRDADYSKNVKNRTSSRGSSSKYLGVCLIKNKYWRATIMINSKNKVLGHFKTEELAALAYNESAKIHHKDFANLNIINQ